MTITEINKDRETGVIDARGNKIEVGSEIILTNVPKVLLCRVVGYNPGGVSLNPSNNQKTPRTIRIISDLTLTLHPNSNYLTDIYRIVNPESEEILAKILNSPLTQ